MIQALDVYPAFENHEKAFMEYIFIDGHTKEKAALNSPVKNSLEALLAGFLAKKLYNLSKNTSEKNLSTQAPEASPKKTKDSYADAFAALLPEASPANAIATILVSLGAYKAYTAYQQFINWIASIKVLTKFLEEWDKNQEYTPENFQPFFDELADIYNLYGEEIFYDCAEDIVEGLQFIIKRTELKVSEVYKKEFENNASGSSIFDTPKFLGDILKHTKEIIKL